MLIAANIGVVDEMELIERHLAHLRRIGVDHIVVTDTGSVDGTLEYLRTRAAEGELTLVDSAPEGADHFDYANRMLALTQERFAPDWVVFGDADEFLLPRGGDLRAVLASQTADVLKVTRLNIALGAEGPLWPGSPGDHDDAGTWLLSRPIPRFAAHLQAQPDTPWILGEVMPKVLARGSAVRQLAMGAHGASGAAPTVTVDSPDLLIAHLAFSGEARFRRKLDNIRKVFATYPDRFPGNAAWHWKRWLALADAGQAGEEFRRQVFSAEELARRRAEGSLENAAAWFARRAEA